MISSAAFVRFARTISTTSFVAAAFLGCDSAKNGTSHVTPPVLRESQASLLAVTDAFGAAIPGAKVLIGTRAGQPFPGNVVTTDQDGKVALPKAWTTPLPVSIEATGHVRTTYMNVTPSSLTLQVRKVPNRQRVEVAGVTTNYGALPKDGFVEVGLIATPIRRSQLLNFQAASFISPVTDRLKLPLGKSVDVPSNVSIPRQKENYIISVTLDKPAYRMYLEPPYDYRLLALHVKFPLKATIDGFQDGKNVFELINNFEMVSAGYRDVKTDAPSANQDIAVGSVALGKTITVKAPQYDPELTMLTGAFAPMGPLYFPSDLKQLDPGATRTLKFPSDVTAPGLVLSFLRKKGTDGDYKGASADEYSSAIMPTDSNAPVEMLTMTSAPKVQGNAISFQVPDAPASVRKRGMYVIRSGINLLRDSRVNVEDRIPQWDIFTTEWSDKIELPELDSPIISTTAVNRWEVMFLGDAASNRNESSIGPSVLESVSHVSKSAVDF